MNTILKELKHHSPFTVFGALSGVFLMLVFRNMSHQTEHTLFYIFHPLHIVLSAIVTTSMYKIHQCAHHKDKCSKTMLIFIGYVGAIGIATLSDSIIPFIGEKLLNLPHAHVHAGFIEEWYLVNPAAFLGIAIGYFWPHTKLPHAGHVLISTWASLFHVMMALGAAVALSTYIGIFVFLFLSVWVPCCVSDIVFPMFFVKKQLCCR